MSLDKYDPIRVLGEGSFGKVYLMRDKIRRNFVCVKVIKIKNIAKKEREATKVEVDLLRKLHHPNIVRYIDSFLSKNSESLCICMEYCDGGDLASQIKTARRNLFSEGKILHWFVQLALGLHYMHTNKVLHRDLKTQNIFLLGNGRLVLGDLGISKVLDGTMDFAQTCIGTPYYMSPEIFQNKPYSYKSDVWALGCVLYEMTTLNHAFDAQSLNGLACKIIKGRYPPIHHKYSKYLRDLITQMLMVDPRQRPDMDQILRKPFIKKHTINFFMDIASRPQAGISEGTMIVRGAAGGSVSSSLSSDTNMLALQKQLQILDMTDSIKEALAPKEIPVDPMEAKKLAKEQAGALKREEEHKRMVEMALEKMRKEREDRLKNRGKPVQPSVIKKAVPSAGPSSVRPSAPAMPSRPSQEALNKEARDRDPLRREPANIFGVGKEAMRDGKDPIRDGKAAIANQPINSKDRYAAEVERKRKEEQEKMLADRERKIAEEKRKLQQEYEAKAEERRREFEAATAREEARHLAEMKLKEAAAAREKQELKAQQDAIARRDLQREKERIRQREEIEQLKRDKIELDRRTEEREKVREQRKQEERQRLEEAKKQDDNDINRGRYYEEKGSDNMSAKDRVVQMKRERQLREDNERMQALRVAEDENRRIREMASNKNRGQYQSNNPLKEKEESKYEFENTRPKKDSRPSMDLGELSDRLTEVTGSNKPRYEQTPLYDATVPRNRGVLSEAEQLLLDSDDSSSDETELWNNNNSNSSSNNNISNDNDEDEDMKRREEELQTELHIATLRCNELKKTLLQTKSVIVERLGTAKGGQRNTNANNVTPIIANVDDSMLEDDDDDEEDIYDEDTYEVEDDDYFEEPKAPPSKKQDIQLGQGLIAKTRGLAVETKEDPHATPVKSNNNGNRMAVLRESPAYHGLADPPTPTGRLSDRIERLRQRCIEALGREAFHDAYNFLKSFDDQYTSAAYEDDREDEKMNKMKAILGDSKAHYTPLIEQLIFMEETHSG